jgi:hypothetical protein
MNIVEVADKKTRQQFLDVARMIYKDDKFWVCPLDMDINGIFNPGKNVFFRKGEAARWILMDERYQVIGRIAAFIDREKAVTWDQPTGGMGFFECIESKEAAFLLFDTAKKWLESKGMEAMDGPVNFGENERFWGLLIDGFTQPGFGMPYNPAYYQSFFEDYGFREFYKQYSYHLDLTKEFPNRFWKIAEWVSKKPGYSFRHFEWKEKEKFIADLVQIYNDAWSASREAFTPMDPNDIRNTLDDAKLIVDERFIWFAYYENHPIAFFIIFPDVNQILKPLKGKLNIINILRFLWMKKTGKMTRLRAFVAGVVPKFQNVGIESAIFWHLDKVMDYKQYKELELSWVGDFNHKMLSLYEAVGGKLAKTHITYRYLFNPEAEFKSYKEYFHQDK